MNYLQAIKYGTWSRIREHNWERDTYGSNRAHILGALNEASAALEALIEAIRKAMRKSQELNDIAFGSGIPAEEVLAGVCALEPAIPRLEGLRHRLRKPPRKRATKALRQLPALDGTLESDDACPILKQQRYRERDFRQDTRALLIAAGAPDTRATTALAESLSKDVVEIPPYWRDLPLR